MKYEIPGVKNKVCVITGGAGVIGTSLGSGLAEAGAKVAIVDFNLERANEVANLINEKLTPVLSGFLQMYLIKIY